jgi:hypothetical protein
VRINPGFFPGVVQLLDRSNKPVDIGRGVWWLLVEAKSQLFFKLCSDHLAIEAIPRRKLVIDLSRARHRLEAGYTPILSTQYFIVLRSSLGEEITLRRDGRMIIRNAKSESNAHSAAERLLTLVMT